MTIDGRTFESLALHAYAVQEGVGVLANWKREHVIEVDGVTEDGVLLEVTTTPPRERDLYDVDRRRRFLDLDAARLIVPSGVPVPHTGPRGVEVWRLEIDRAAWSRLYAAQPADAWPEAWENTARWSHFRFRLLSGAFVKVPRTPRTFGRLARVVGKYRKNPPAQMWQSVLGMMNAQDMGEKARRYYVRPSASPLGFDVEDVAHAHHHRINPRGFCQRCLEDSARAASHLVAVLRDRGFRDILATWSGSRGFHVYAMDAARVWPGCDALDMPTQARARASAFAAVLEAAPWLSWWLDSKVTPDPMRIMKVPGSVDRSGCVVEFVPTEKLLSYTPHSVITDLATLRRGTFSSVPVVQADDPGREADLLEEVRR